MTGRLGVNIPLIIWDLRTQISSILWVVPLPRIPVTTRIDIFLVGDPNLNLHFPQLLGGGTTQSIQNTKHLPKVALLRFVLGGVQRCNCCPAVTLVEVGSLSTIIYKFFLHPRWCRISSINSMDNILWIGSFQTFDLSQNLKSVFSSKNRWLFSETNEIVFETPGVSQDKKEIPNIGHKGFFRSDYTPWN